MTQAPDALSQTFAALADPTRRAILAQLSHGPATVNELAAPFDISLPAISRHLKVLEGAGLIARGREAQWRQCELKAVGRLALAIPEFLGRLVRPDGRLPRTDRQGRASWPQETVS
jgi:DNA-binding transcriptional ArsR family regulator